MSDVRVGMRLSCAVCGSSGVVLRVGENPQLECCGIPLGAPAPGSGPSGSEPDPGGHAR